MRSTTHCIGLIFLLALVPAAAPAQEFEVHLLPATHLNDGDSPVLVNPQMLAFHPEIGWIITDRSDRDLKVYDSQGIRTASFGAAGYGMGRFSALTSGFVQRGHVVAFDYFDSRLTAFTIRGAVAKSTHIDASSGKPLEVKDMDDSLLIAIRHPKDAYEGPLIGLLRPDASSFSEVFDRSEYFEDDGALIYYSNVVADGRDGCIFAATATRTVISVLDLQGNVLAEGAVSADAESDMRTWLAERREGVGGGPNSFAEPGAQYVAGIVALGGCKALVQLNRYDEEGRPTRRIDGGMIHLVQARQGKISTYNGIGVEGLLAGRRDDQTGVLILKTADQSGYDLQLVEVTSIEEAPRHD